ISRQMC
ncbi:hypothetical protein VCNEP21106_003743B, partial [Vibrio cholerae O1 str. Nep-21106]